MGSQEEPWIIRAVAWRWLRQVQRKIRDDPAMLEQVAKLNIRMACLYGGFSNRVPISFKAEWFKWSNDLDESLIFLDNFDELCGCWQQTGDKIARLHSTNSILYPSQPFSTQQFSKAMTSEVFIFQPCCFPFLSCTNPLSSKKNNRNKVSWVSWAISYIIIWCKMLV